jgi:hypothetical protein
MAEHAVALQCLDRGTFCAAARGRLADALGAPVADPDPEGIIEVRVEAADFEGALQRTWDAMAAAGADDHLAFAEHPDIPFHWRRRDGGDGLPGALA